MLSRFLTSPSRLGLRRMSESIANSKNSISGIRSASGSSVDHEEVLKFTRKSAEWWSSYEALRLMNAVRVPFIRDGLLSMSQVTEKNPLPLKGYEIIDVGCGGGILSESLARLGASVTGLDPGPENIEVAIDHASEDHEIKDRLTYICDSIENLATTDAGKYDAVVCSEVIEHVADVHSFVNSCVEVTKDGGSLFFTTINRTFSSYLLAIIGAEYVLRMIPTGTHDWNKFITPEELSEMLQSLNCRTVSIDGMMYNPITKTWSFTNCHDFYALHACKNE